MTIIPLAIVMTAGLILAVMNHKHDMRFVHMSKEVEQSSNQENAYENMHVKHMMALFLFLFSFMLTLATGEISAINEMMSGALKSTLYYFGVPFLFVQTVLYLIEKGFGYTKKEVKIHELLAEDLLKDMSCEEHYYILKKQFVEYQLIPVSLLRELNQKYRIYKENNVNVQQLKKKEGQDENTLQLIKQAEEKLNVMKKEIEGLLKSFANQLVEQGVKNEQEQLIEDVEMLLNSNPLTKTKREPIEVQELKRLTQSKELPAEVVQKAGVVLQQVLKNKEAFLDTSQPEIDDAVAIIKAARMLNGLEETKGE